MKYWNNKRNVSRKIHVRSEFWGPPSCCPTKYTLQHYVHSWCIKFHTMYSRGTNVNTDPFRGPIYYSTCVPPLLLGDSKIIDFLAKNVLKIAILTVKKDTTGLQVLKSAIFKNPLLLCFHTFWIFKTSQNIRCFSKNHPLYFHTKCIRRHGQKN